MKCLSEVDLSARIYVIIYKNLFTKVRPLGRNELDIKQCVRLKIAKNVILSQLKACFQALIQQLSAGQLKCTH